MVLFLGLYVGNVNGVLEQHTNIVCKLELSTKMHTHQTTYTKIISKFIFIYSAEKALCDKLFEGQN